MDLQLHGKTALVTGASKGIGHAVAVALAAEGCNLVLVSRDTASLEAARTAIGATANVGIEIFAADLAAGGSVDALAAGFPDIDILVNNAGAIPPGSLSDIDEAKWRTAWDLKVFGYINMCRAFYALMQRRGGGVIVNVIGTAALTRDPGYICGVAGNAALTAFTQSLGSVSPRDGIRVLGVSPGPVTTERLVTMLRKRAGDENGNPDGWQDLLRHMPFARAATPQEVAAMVTFLASGQSAYTSGAVLTVDAGASGRHA